MIPVAHKQLIVTTSWDDGDPRDWKVADRLVASGVRGTFYVPLTGNLGGPTLSSSEIRSLAFAGFEVGAHTVSHRSLTGLSLEEVRHEVRDSKKSLQDILGHEVSMFCYPRGRYDARVLQEVRRAGFEGARTTRMLSLRADFPRFEMPTTVQAYPHSTLAYMRNLTRGKNVPGLFRYITSLRFYRRWADLGRVLFDQALEEGGVWHLYGHSWEIDELGLWGQLAELLRYVGGRDGVIYATNSEALKLLQSDSPQVLAGCPA